MFLSFTIWCRKGSNDLVVISGDAMAGRRLLLGGLVLGALAVVVEWWRGGMWCDSDHDFLCVFSLCWVGVFCCCWRRRGRGVKFH